MTISSMRARNSKIKAEINVVPYIDVMLVLLIIFMITAPLLNLGIDVRLPQINASVVEQPPSQIVVQIDEHGRLSLIQQTDRGASLRVSITRNALVQQIAAYREKHPNLIVLVAGAGTVQYASVLDVLQVLRTEAKVPRATLLTESVENTGR